MKIKQVAQLLNQDSKSKKWKQNVNVFSGFNILIIFVKEPLSQLYFMMECVHAIPPARRFILKEYTGKSPSEWMDELFYFGKTKYLITSVKSEAIEKLFKRYHIYGKIPQNKSRQEEITESVHADYDKKGIKRIEGAIDNYQKAYTKLAKYPTKYFEVIDMSQKSSKDIKQAKQKIKHRDFAYAPKRAKSSTQQGKKSSADVVPKLIKFILGKNKKSTHKNDSKHSQK